MIFLEGGIKMQMNVITILISTMLIVTTVLPIGLIDVFAEDACSPEGYDVSVFNLTKQEIIQSKNVSNVFIYDIKKDNIDFTTWFNDSSQSWWQEIEDSKKELLLWNRMGTNDQITNSEIGPNGTINGTLIYSDNKFGNGVNTTGINNYIEFDNVSTGDQKWTVDFYFTPLQDYICGSTNTHGQGVWLMGYDSTGTYMYAFYWNSLYKILFTELAPTRLSLKYPDVDFEANRIYHIRLVVDRTLSGSNRHKLFINGEFQTPVVHADYGNVDKPLDRLRFGAHFPTPPKFDGSAIFDNIKIYNYSNLNFEERFNEDNSERNSHFPQRSYLITTDEGLDIIDASNKKLWMRFEEGTNNGLPSTDFNAVEAMDGKVYVGSDEGLFKIDFIDNIISRIDSDGVAPYDGIISTRNDGKGYSTMTGTGIINDTVNDIALTTNYALVGTDGGVSSINLSSGAVYDDSGDVCSAVHITDDCELIYCDPDNLLRLNSLPVSDWNADNSTYITGINDIVANDDEIFVAVEGGEVAVVNITRFNVSEQIVKSSFDDSKPHFWNKMENVVDSTLVSEVGTNLTLTGTSYDIEPAMFDNGWDNNVESTYAYANSNDIIACSQQGAVEFYWVPDDDANTTLGWHPPPGSHNKASWFFSNGATNTPVNDRWYFEMVYAHYHNPPNFQCYFGKTDSFGNYHRCDLWPHHTIRGNWTAGDRVHVAFAWHNESVILGKYICALWFNGELQYGWIVPDFGTLEGWRTTNPTTPYDPRMRIGDSRFPYTSDEQLRGPMDNVKTYAYAKDDWGDRHIENGSITKVFAGDSGNVKALALADDDTTLYIGISDGGGISKIDTLSNVLLCKWTSGANEPLVDYNITSMSYWQHPVSENEWELLVGTKNGVSVIRHEQKPPTADAGGPYTYNEGSEVTLDASGSYDSLGSELEYRWDFDNDSVWDTSYSSDPTVTHTWYDDYSDLITVEVSNGLSADTDTTEITILNVDPSITSVTGPTDPVLVSDSCVIECYFSDNGIEDTHTATINWGDETETNPDVDETAGSGSFLGTHEYSEAGTYILTITVEDDDDGIVTVEYESIEVTSDFIESIKDYIGNLDDDAFSKNADNRKKNLQKQLDSVNSLIEDGKYERAIKKLETNILPRVDGITKGNSEDWISDPDTQEYLCDLIDRLIEYLGSMI